MDANRTLDLIVKERGRKAVLRSELLTRSHASSSSCDRALQRSCQQGTLVRVGRGIYGIGKAKVFDIVPEVMPKLGYRIKPAHKVTGYSQKHPEMCGQLTDHAKEKFGRKGFTQSFNQQRAKY